VPDSAGDYAWISALAASIELYEEEVGCGGPYVMVVVIFYFFFCLIVSVFMFDYISTIISYSLVGVAIFTGHYDHLTPSQLASVVSKVKLP